MPISMLSGKRLGVLDQDQLLVVVAEEGIFGLQLDLRLLMPNLLAVQGLFEQRKDAIVAAVQINERVLAVVDHRAFGVARGYTSASPRYS